MIMFVYVVTIFYDYEGETVEGVFSSLEKAQEYADSISHWGDEILIHKFNLDT